MNIKSTTGWIGTTACIALAVLTAALWFGNAIAATYSYFNDEDVSSFGARMVISLVIGMLPVIVAGVVYRASNGSFSVRVRRATSKAAWVSWPFLFGFFLFSV